MGIETGGIQQTESVEPISYFDLYDNVSSLVESWSPTYHISRRPLPLKSGPDLLQPIKVRKNGAIPALGLTLKNTCKFKVLVL